MKKNRLEKDIAVLGNVFSLKDILSIEPDNEYITRYYKVNRIPYRLFHTKTDLMYMGISKDGVYKEDDLLAHARFVQQHIEKLDASRVLELATGRGANSAFLASNNPDVALIGIDLSPGQLQYARKRARKLNNYQCALGDYHDLSRFADESFDIVFIVEALCYSTKKEIVLREVKRILKSGGYFIVIDGYRSTENMDEIERTAMELLEKGMALRAFETYDCFLAKATDSGFDIAYEEDASRYILPTLGRFRKLAESFLKRKYLNKILVHFLPKKFLYNVVSGYLFPTVIEKGLAVYQLTVFEKK